MSVFVWVVIGLFVAFCLLLAFALAKTAARSDAEMERMFKELTEPDDKTTI